jgi:hypothetical protein
MIATETLYRTSSGEIVREGSPGAAFLVCRAGASVPDDVVKKYGLKFDKPASSTVDAGEPMERTSRAISSRSLRRRTE